MKCCSKCKAPKSPGDFHFKKASTGRKKSICKSCASEERRKRYDNNREKELSVNKNWARENRGAACECVKRYNKKNRKSISEKEKTRYYSDPNFRLRKILRSRFSTALNRKSLPKKKSVIDDLLGCPVVWLEAYLEELFLPGMTWGNCGPVWHIDHIRPCSNFDLTDLEQQHQCFHWTNLQPLFAGENLQKSDKYDPSN